MKEKIELLDWASLLNQDYNQEWHGNKRIERNLTDKINEIITYINKNDL